MTIKTGSNVSIWFSAINKTSALKLLTACNAYIVIGTIKTWYHQCQQVKNHISNNKSGNNLPVNTHMAY